MLISFSGDQRYRCGYCSQSGCSPVGMKRRKRRDKHHGEDYDVAGFCVGMVKIQKSSTDLKSATAMSIVLGSSGPHSNGYSLVPKILEVSGCDRKPPNLMVKPLADHLLAPTRIYVKSVLKLIEKVAMCMPLRTWTGGGFWENIPRVLPDNTQAVIDESSWQWPEVFNWLQTAGNVERHEMYRTFNCGVGMIIAPALLRSGLSPRPAPMPTGVKTRGKSGIIKASDSEQRVVIG